jgi:hydrogenase-4 component E
VLSAYTDVTSIPGLNMDSIQIALGLIVITNICLLAAERLRLCIRLIALQGVILGLLPLLTHTGEIDARLMVMCAVVLLIKAVALPLVLRRTYKKLPPQRPDRPYLGSTLSVLAGFVGFVFSLWLSSRLGLTANPLFSLFFAPAFATIFTGLLLIVAHRGALFQMFGYLVMENGIYLLGVPMAQQNTFWLELSVLLDIMVAAFVMTIAIHHIHRAFRSTDVDRFASIKD